MLNVSYRLGRLFMSRGWIVGLLLIVLTIGFGTTGFLDEKFDSGKEHGFLDALYKAASLLAIQTGSLPTSGNWRLELARWLGMLFFASALLTFVIRLSREAVHRLLVKVFAREHVVVAGLGQYGGRLVEALRAGGRTVVVVEPNRNHPAVEQCRRLGAVVLFGEPDDARMLRAANLSKATAVLALFLEERDCVRTATAAYQVLAWSSPASRHAIGESSGRSRSASKPASAVRPPRNSPPSPRWNTAAGWPASASKASPTAKIDPRSRTHT